MGLGEQLDIVGRFGETDIQVRHLHHVDRLHRRGDAVPRIAEDVHVVDPGVVPPRAVGFDLEPVDPFQGVQVVESFQGPAGNRLSGGASGPDPNLQRRVSPGPRLHGEADPPLLPFGNDVRPGGGQLHRDPSFGPPEGDHAVLGDPHPVLAEGFGPLLHVQEEVPAAAVLGFEFEGDGQGGRLGRVQVVAGPVPAEGGAERAVPVGVEGHIHAVRLDGPGGRTVQDSVPHLPIGIQAVLEVLAEQVPGSRTVRIGP